MSRIFGSLLAALLLFGTSKAEPQPKECLARIDGQGSLPPLPQLYKCVRDLNGKMYDSAQTQRCLDTILASGYFRSGRVDMTLGPSNVTVDFVLTAPSLVITELDFDVEKPFKEPMLAWILKTGDILKVGDVYRENHDVKTEEVLGFYFRKIGKKAGIRRVAKLDYNSGSVALKYQITVGPDIVPVRALPPYEVECPQRVATFNFSEADDFVPVNLVEKMTKIRAFGCFNPEDLTSDRQTLTHSGLFRDVEYDVRNESDGSTIGLRIKGKPLKIKEIRIAGYGLLSDRLAKSDEDLRMKSGDQYQRSMAEVVKDYLANSYANPGRIIEVTEDDQLTGSGELIVTFNLLAFEQDTVTINGKDYQIAPIVINVHS
jgi:hypothetical protein